MIKMGWFDIIKIHKLQSNVSEKLELQSNFRDVVTRKVDEAIGKLDYDEDDYTLFEWITDYPVKIFLGDQYTINVEAGEDDNFNVLLEGHGVNKPIGIYTIDGGLAIDMKSFNSIPITILRKLVGILGVYSGTPERWSSENYRPKEVSAAIGTKYSVKESSARTNRREGDYRS